MEVDTSWPNHSSTLDTFLICVPLWISWIHLILREGVSTPNVLAGTSLFINDVEVLTFMLHICNAVTL